MKSLGTFFAVALLISGFVASQAFAGSGKGKMGGMDRAMKADRMERSLDREFTRDLDRDIDNFDAGKVNERFTKELKDLKEEFDKGDIGKSEFDEKAAELKADFLRDIEAVNIEDFDFDNFD